MQLTTFQHKLSFMKSKRCLATIDHIHKSLACFTQTFTARSGPAPIAARRASTFLMIQFRPLRIFQFSSLHTLTSYLKHILSVKSTCLTLKPFSQRPSTNLHGRVIWHRSCRYRTLRWIALLVGSSTAMRSRIKGRIIGFKNNNWIRSVQPRISPTQSPLPSIWWQSLISIRTLWCDMNYKETSIDVTYLFFHHLSPSWVKR